MSFSLSSPLNSSRLSFQEMRRRGDTLAEVRCYDEMRGAASGGTLATV
jgi:hypothetical protein